MSTYPAGYIEQLARPLRQRARGERHQRSLAHRARRPERDAGESAAPADDDAQPGARADPQHVRP